jgi:pimeloyl-ACP methyl ester carboxylesterase
MSRAMRAAQGVPRRWAGSLAGLVLALASTAATASTAAALALAPCRLAGVEHEARCGSLRRPLDPSRADGPQIDIHVAVLPAVARNKKPDPVLFFAGGPGQSAIGLAGTVSRLYARLLNRRDLILVDQRGTGRSAPLACEPEMPTRPLAEGIDPVRQAKRLAECREALQKLPYGDLRQFTTAIAVADADAVRAALGVQQVNLIGGSYGTRAALEYLRQFPRRVRRVVLDGVAPPDMALPGSFSPDAQRAFDALLAACEAEPACRGRYPSLRAQWKAVLAGLPRDVVVSHPVTGREERLTLTRDMLLGLVRLPLYAPALAAALPYAISEAAAGRHGAIVGLASSLGSGSQALELAMGMHFSVVCSEDMPMLGRNGDQPGADFGEATLGLYREACAAWPRGAVPPAFYTLAPTPAATLLLSGGDDPVTSPRHGERVARALGAKARHVVVPHAGHGTIPIGCLRDVVFRFIDQDDEAVALAGVSADAQCAATLPRPPAFALPVAPGTPAPVWPPPAASAPKLPDPSRYSKADR